MAPNLGMKRTLVHIAFNPFLGWVSGNRKPKFLVPDRPITSFTDIYCFTYRRTNMGIYFIVMFLVIKMEFNYLWLIYFLGSKLPKYFD